MSIFDKENINKFNKICFSIFVILASLFLIVLCYSTCTRIINEKHRKKYITLNNESYSNSLIKKNELTDQKIAFLKKKIEFMDKRMEAYDQSIIKFGW